MAGPTGYTSTATVAELEAGLAPPGTYVLPNWEQTAASDQPERVLVCGWGETAFMCRSGTACRPWCLVSGALLLQCNLIMQYVALLAIMLVHL